MISLRDRAKDVALGFHMMYPAAGIIEGVHSDWDWLWIDQQHGQFDDRSIYEALRTASSVQLPAIVRVPGHSSERIGQVLDAGADGIMVPVVETAEEAESIVQAARFPPRGKRSFGGRRPIDRVGREYYTAPELQPFIVVQIETPLGLANCEAIAATDGVDAIFLGADDLKISMGFPVDTPPDHPSLLEATQKVASAAHDAGIVAGAVVLDAVHLNELVAFGYTLLASCSDSRAIRTVSQSTSSQYRAELSSRPRMKE